MRLVHLEENRGNYITHAFELRGHLIEIQLTIWGARRITIREVGSFVLKSNWCAGKDIKHTEILLGLAKHCVENDIVYPEYNRKKPYYRDARFLKWMLPLKTEPFRIPSDVSIL